MPRNEGRGCSSPCGTWKRKRPGNDFNYPLAFSELNVNRKAKSHRLASAPASRDQALDSMDLDVSCASPTALFHPRASAMAHDADAPALAAAPSPACALAGAPVASCIYCKWKGGFQDFCHHLASRHKIPPPLCKAIAKSLLAMQLREVEAERQSAEDESEGVGFGARRELACRLDARERQLKSLCRFCDCFGRRIPHFVVNFDEGADAADLPLCD